VSEPRRFGGIFDYDIKRERLEEVSRELEDSAIWDTPDKAQKLGQERVRLAEIVETVVALESGLNEADDMLALAASEDDQETFEAVVADMTSLQSLLEKLEFQRMFSGEMDANNAFLDIQAGSGGTEAQDWASMVMRMFLRWGERQGFKTELVEVSAGDVAGIKSATISFEGDYAYGWLRTETGVHRLVRKSPFNANGKRHTSFCSVFVSPEVDDDVEIDLNPADLKIDTYRSSGAGGQHVNTTDSAIRITHLPTNTVVQCQSDRSQHKNKAGALKQMKAKLYELEMLNRNKEKQALEETKSDIGWGSQIRSYVLDESRIKDLRTSVETHNTKAILDGDLNAFMTASLKAGL
jgi:peptide chain release factor 2